MSNQTQTKDRLSTADLARTTTATPDQADAPERRDTQRDEDAPMHEATASPAERNGGSDENDPALTPLFPADLGDGYRDRWHTVQTNFVDDPRKAVEEADGLVALVIKELAQTFADERGKLEQQWGRGEDVSTEDLRVALQRYRSFFDRLLSV